ncbi:hypothetical protein D3C75_1271590 [compost metagenome]
MSRSRSITSKGSMIPARLRGRVVVTTSRNRRTWAGTKTVQGEAPSHRTRTVTRPNGLAGLSSVAVNSLSHMGMRKRGSS